MAKVQKWSVVIFQSNSRKHKIVYLDISLIGCQKLPAQSAVTVKYEGQGVEVMLQGGAAGQTDAKQMQQYEH